MSTALEARVAVLEARLALVESRLAGSAPSSSGGGTVGEGAIASDHDLDSQYGDELIRKDPPRWKGDSFAGCKMSQCSSEYLRDLAGFFDWKAEKDTEQGTYKNAKGDMVPTRPQYARKSAARARGWAKRNEGLTSGPSVASAAGGNDNGSFNYGGQATGSDDEIPF